MGGTRPPARPAPLTGGCLCGSVRYRAAGEVTNATVCHCASCRRAAGAPMVAWISVPRAGFAFTGAPPVRYRSSPPVVRTFCGRCGTPIGYEREDEPETLDVTIASLDRPDDAGPADHTWWSESLSWVARLGGLPRFARRRHDGG